MSKYVKILLRFEQVKSTSSRKKERWNTFRDNFTFRRRIVLPSYLYSKDPNDIQLCVSGKFISWSNPPLTSQLTCKKDVEHKVAVSPLVEGRTNYSSGLCHTACKCTVLCRSPLMSPLTLLFKGAVITEVRFVAAIATSNIHRSLEQSTTLA